MLDLPYETLLEMLLAFRMDTESNRTVIYDECRDAHPMLTGLNAFAGEVNELAPDATRLTRQIMDNITDDHLKLIVARLNVEGHKELHGLERMPLAEMTTELINHLELAISMLDPVSPYVTNAALIIRKQRPLVWNSMCAAIDKPKWSVEMSETSTSDHHAELSAQACNAQPCENENVELEDMPSDVIASGSKPSGMAAMAFNDEEFKQMEDQVLGDPDETAAALHTVVNGSISVPQGCSVHNPTIQDKLLKAMHVEAVGKRSGNKPDSISKKKFH